MGHEYSEKDVTELCKREYIIVEGSEPLLLHIRVNQMMNFGYTPTGGLAAYVFDGRQRGIYQAMLRKGVAPA